MVCARWPIVARRAVPDYPRSVATTIQVVRRALDILELLASEAVPIGITEIGRRLDLAKSTTSRLVGELRERGYVEREAGSRQYRLGPAAVGLAGRYLRGLPLEKLADEPLRELSRVTGHTAFVAVRDGAQIVYLGAVTHAGGLHRTGIVGRRKPLHCTSLGKALLMGLAADEIERVVGPGPLVAPTERTITGIENLVADIAAARERGWSLDDLEDEIGTRCVGSPVRDYLGNVVASVSVSWRAERVPAPSPPEVAREVIAAATRVSKMLGWEGPAE